MDGILIINKPIGFTSQDAVSKVKKILNTKKAGHIGTLDPMATGVLPILLGKYTKISKYLIEHDKKYIAKLKLGERTDTGDKEGNIVETKKVNLDYISKDNVLKVLKTFIGKQYQIPPLYSSVKVNGKKLYEYARAGEKVEIKPREIEIYNINLINIDKNKLEIEFEISCSKGTYIRTVCEDIANKLNNIGHMCSLTRICVDKFKIENAIDFEILDKNKNNYEFLKNNIINIEQIFSNYNKIILDERKEKLFLNGVMLTFDLEDGIYNIYNHNKSHIGTGIVKQKLLKRDVVII